MGRTKDRATFSKEIWIDEVAGAMVTADFCGIPMEKKSRLEEAANAFLEAAEEILKGTESEKETQV